MGNSKKQVVGKEHVVEILRYAAIYGDEEACHAYRIAVDTLRRYRGVHPDARLTALAELNGKTSTEELEILAASGGAARVQRVKVTDFRGEDYTFAHVSDTHWGHKDADPGWWASVVAECRRLKITELYHTGDVTEGMSHRPGHIYELTHLGYKRQKAYAVGMLEKFDGNVYVIDGNHDRWFEKSNGAAMVEDICATHPDRWHFLGQDEGSHVVNGVDIRSHHGEDGASYAVSYRVQKIVEAYQGGEKPRVLLLGHDHKAVIMPNERNVYAVGGGTLQHQTSWMRGKRLAAHCGWWVHALTIRDREVKAAASRFYPFYK